MENNTKIKTLQKNVCQLSLSDGVKDCSSEHTYQFHIQCLKNNVVILYPALCSPLIIKPSENIWMTIAADKGFYRTFLEDRDTNRTTKIGGIQIRRLLNTFIKVEPWKKKEFSDKPLFTYSDKPEDHINCYYLGRLSKSKLKLNRRLGETEVIFSTIRSAVKDVLVETGLDYLFQIDISLPELTEGMYHITWITPELFEKNKKTVFCERQDLYIEQFIKANKEQGSSTDINHLLYAYNIDKLSKEDVFELSLENPVQSYHPVFVTNKDYLSIGHLTDVHVSSRQHAFVKSKARVIFGNTKKELSPPIGKMVNVSFHNLKDLMDQLGSSVDILIITGDVYDFLINLDLVSIETDLEINKNLWKLFNTSDTDNLEKNYVKGIDFITIYTLFKYFYDTYKKPILFVTGNHEAYNLPYGISPRLLKLKRANEGIPADHNLTIYEAILMFGRSYGSVPLIERRKVSNFEWTYNILTPLNNFIIETSKQCFLGLEWGDDEELADTPYTGHGVGHLPRANKSINSVQYSLISTVQELKKDIKILFAHFTFVNYAGKQKITDKGKVYTSGLLNLRYNTFNHGTFEKNFHEVYKNFIVNNTFRYTISGHSHRAGLYKLSDGGFFHPHECQGFDPYATEKSDNLSTFEKNKTRILVSPSGGPIPVQNYNHELKTFGLASPAATAILFDNEGNDSLKGFFSTKPRFAVALDYFDILGPSVIKTFKSDENENIFSIDFQEDLNLPDWNFIKEICFSIYMSGGNFETYTISNLQSENNSIKIDIEKKVLLKLSFTSKLFISIIFNDELGKYNTFSHYNFKSPWNYPIQFSNNFVMVYSGYYSTFMPVSVPVPGYTIERDDESGEVPDLDWYESFL